MKETKELFERATLLKDFDDASLETLISMRNNISILISQIEVAKRNGYYFECGPELASYSSSREAVYDRLFSEDLDMDKVFPDSRTETKVFALKRNLKSLSKKNKK